MFRAIKVSTGPVPPVPPVTPGVAAAGVRRARVRELRARKAQAAMELVESATRTLSRVTSGVALVTACVAVALHRRQTAFADGALRRPPRRQSDGRCAAHHADTQTGVAPPTTLTSRKAGSQTGVAPPTTLTSKKAGSQTGVAPPITQAGV
jgi:hypothetical protein